MRAICFAVGLACRGGCPSGDTGALAAWQDLPTVWPPALAPAVPSRADNRGQVWTAVFAAVRCAMRLHVRILPRIFAGHETAKDLTLSPRAVARGEQIAVETGKSLSAVIEAQLLAIPTPGKGSEDYWPGPAFKRISRPGDRRSQYLNAKHRA